MGTCGEDASLRLAKAGLDVVGIEPNLIGGECPYWACLPSKWMVRTANLVAEAKRAEGLVGKVTVEPDWGLVASGVRAEVTGSWDDSAGVARFEAKGGRVVRGSGRMVGPKQVEVDGNVFNARRGVLVATGSAPILPPVKGLTTGPYWTNHEAIATEKLPESLLILGGGAVGCELGQVFARFGSEVTIVERSSRILFSEEPEVSDLLTERLGEDGVRVLTGRGVAEAAYGDGEVVLTLEDGTGIRGSNLLVATGRRSRGDQVGADLAGARVEDGAIVVDGRMRAADGLWAIGDVTGVSYLTAVAEYQGRIAVEDILGADPAPADYDAIPRAVFTDPELGAVGLTEAEARQAGHDVDVVVKAVPASFRGWLHRTGNSGIIKLVAERNQRRLLGASFAGPHGTDVLGFLALAVGRRIPIDDLINTVYAFPTFYGAVGEALGAYGRGIVRVLDPDTAPLVDDPV